MKPRLNYAKAAPGVFDSMDPIEQYLESCGLEAPLLHLIRFRASQINGCAYCLDMHSKDLRALGESEQRLTPGVSSRTTPIASAPRWSGRRP